MDARPNLRVEGRASRGRPVCRWPADVAAGTGRQPIRGCGRTRSRRGGGRAARPGAHARRHQRVPAAQRAADPAGARCVEVGRDRTAHGAGRRPAGSRRRQRGHASARAPGLQRPRGRRARVRRNRPARHPRQRDDLPRPHHLRRQLRSGSRGAALVPGMAGGRTHRRPDRARADDRRTGGDPQRDAGRTGLGAGCGDRDRDVDPLRRAGLRKGADRPAGGDRIARSVPPRGAARPSLSAGQRHPGRRRRLRDRRGAARHRAGFRRPAAGSRTARRRDPPSAVAGGVDRPVAGAGTAGRGADAHGGHAGAPGAGRRRGGRAAAELRADARAVGTAEPAAGRCRYRREGDGTDPRAGRRRHPAVRRAAGGRSGARSGGGGPACGPGRCRCADPGAGRAGAPWLDGRMAAALQRPRAAGRRPVRSRRPRRLAAASGGLCAHADARR